MVCWGEPLQGLACQDTLLLWRYRKSSAPWGAVWSLSGIWGGRDDVNLWRAWQVLYDAIYTLHWDPIDPSWCPQGPGQCAWGDLRHCLRIYRFEDSDSEEVMKSLSSFLKHIATEMRAASNHLGNWVEFSSQQGLQSTGRGCQLISVDSENTFCLVLLHFS